MAGAELRKWLRGEADLHAVDLAAIFAKCKFRKEKAQRPCEITLQNDRVGHRWSAHSGVIGSERVRQALMPTEEERLQRTIDELQKKLAAATAAKSAGASEPGRPSPSARRGEAKGGIEGSADARHRPTRRHLKMHGLNHQVTRSNW